MKFFLDGGSGTVGCWDCWTITSTKITTLQQCWNNGIQGVCPVPVQYMLLEGATMVLICLYYLIPSDHRII